MCAGRAGGIAAGYLADLALADPQRGHPVALFGRAAADLERVTYADDRRAGAAHTATLLGALAVIGVVGERAAARQGVAWTAVITAVATFVALGGTSLARTGARMADVLSRADVDAGRRLLPSLCGRDPAALDADGLARAAVESVAENTSDAQVAPLLWAAVGGVPGLLVYRGANTLDAMIGNRSPRYQRFGWAAARLDDGLNFIAARVTGVLVAICAPVVGGSTCWRIAGLAARRRPTPRARTRASSRRRSRGRWVSGSADPTQYAHQLEIRPTLGDGPAPEISDLVRAVRLSRVVQLVSAVSTTAAVSAACRSGRRASPLSVSGAFGVRLRSAAFSRLRALISETTK